MTDLQVVRKYPQPELTVEEGKVRSTRIGWNHGNATQYLLRNKGCFVSVDEWCRIFYGKVNKDNRRRVRKGFTGLFHYVLENHGMVVVIEPDGKRSGAVKILDKTSEYEQSLVKVKTDRMFALGQLNETKLELVRQLSAPE